MALGQGANAFTQGLQSGFGAVDKAINSKQKREMAMTEASEKAKVRKQQIEASQQTVKGQVLTQELQQVKLDAIDAVRTDDAVKKVPSILNGWMNGETTAKDARQFLTNNATVAEKLGIKNIDTVDDITPSNASNKDSKLHKYLVNNLSKPGQPLDPNNFMMPDPMGADDDSIFDQEAYDAEIVRLATDLAPVLKTADSEIININGLTTMTGGSKNLLSAQQRKTEETLAGIYKKSKDNKPTNNAELMQFAKNEIGTKEEYDRNPQEGMSYQQALNKKFVELKRSTGKSGGLGTTEQRNVEYHEARLNDPKATKAQKEVSRGWLEKHGTTGTIINNKYDEKQTNKTLDMQDQYMGSGIANPDDANAPIKYDVTAPVIKTDRLIETKTRKDKDIYTTELKKEQEQTTKDAKSYRAFSELKALVEDPSFKSGYLDNAINWVKSVTPDYFLKTDAKQIAAEARISIEAAQRLKDMSGASATDQEFLRTLLTSVGDSSQQESARIATIDGFLSSAQSRLDTGIDSLATQGLPSTSKRLYKVAYGEKKPHQTAKTEPTQDEVTTQETRDEKFNANW